MGWHSAASVRFRRWTHCLERWSAIVRAGIRHGGPVWILCCVLSGPNPALMCRFALSPSIHGQCLLSTTAFGQGVFFITFLEGQEAGKNMHLKSDSQWLRFLEIDSYRVARGTAGSLHCKAGHLGWGPGVWFSDGNTSHHPVALVSGTAMASVLQTWSRSARQLMLGPSYNTPGSHPGNSVTFWILPGVGCAHVSHVLEC